MSSTNKQAVINTVVNLVEATWEDKEGNYVSVDSIMEVLEDLKKVEEFKSLISTYENKILEQSHEIKALRDTIKAYKG